MGALVADPRLDQTDWPAMHALLDIASEGLPEPLLHVWSIRRDDLQDRLHDPYILMHVPEAPR